MKSNMMIIHTEKSTDLYSYGKLVAQKFNDGRVYLDKKYHNCSITTSCHITKFLKVASKERKKKIKNKKYVLVYLN